MLKMLGEDGRSELRMQDDRLGVLATDEISLPLEERINSQVKETEIINVVMPEAFKKQLPIEVGDIIDMIVGNTGQQISFRCRIVGSVRRMPGFWDFSAYKPAVWMTPGMIVSQRQYQYLV